MGMSSRDWRDGGYQAGGHRGDRNHYDYSSRHHHEPKRSRSQRGSRWSPKSGRPGGYWAQSSYGEGNRSDRNYGAGDRWTDSRHQGKESKYGGHQDRKRSRDRDRDHHRRRSRESSKYSGSDSRSRSSGSSGKSGGESNNDEIVHFSWRSGQVLHYKYLVKSLLGDGTFGRVVLARDTRDNRDVAIKIIRDVKRYTENAQIEADILKDIRKADPRGSSGLAMMYETFMHEGKFFCLVFEPLGVSLYDFIKKNNFRGFWASDIQSFAQQGLKALKFLHEKLKLTHTDLKPENILLQSMEPPKPSYYPRESHWQEMHKSSSSSSRSKSTDYVRPYNSQIKIIDFGNATYEDEHHSSVINTRQYRGPEVVLELGWKERSDIWSLGCILMELYTGELLFGTHENLEHLALMERIVGPIPKKMLEDAGSTIKSKYLVQSSQSGLWRLKWPEGASDVKSERHVHSQRPLPEMVMEQHKLLASCIGTMLTMLPSKRPSARDCLEHRFFDEEYED